MNLQRAVDLTFSVRPSWISGKGVATNRINSNHFLRILGGDTDVTSIKPSTFTRLGQQLEQEGKAPGTINRILAALHTVLHEAHLEGELAAVPSYRRWKEPEARKEWYSKQEIQTLLDVSLTLPQDGLLLHRSIQFFYFSGCRKNELLKLTWKDVDLENEQVTFTDTKNGSNHSITIHSALLPVLQEMHRERIDEELVFTWGSRDQLNRRFKRLQSITGLGSNRGIHQIRHSVATHLVESQVPIRSIQGLLGHRCLDTTLKYAKVNDKAKADAISNLSL